MEEASWPGAKSRSSKRKKKLEKVQTTKALGGGRRNPLRRRCKSKKVHSNRTTRLLKLSEGGGDTPKMYLRE